ncbi:MAG TPA: ATP-binding protein [Polyangia bacterium]|nr:ATP-binding protein [Polyangia bacterium]
METEPPRARFVSVGVKLTVATIALLGGVTAAVFFGLSGFERERMLSAKEQAARAVGELFLRSVSTPIVFDDPTGIHDSVAHLGLDPEVLGVELWRVGPAREPGAPLASQLRGPGEPSAGARWIDAPAVERRADRVVFRDVVRDPDRKVIALAAVQFSLARENAAYTALRQRILVTAAGVAAVLVLILWGVSRRSIVGPLGRLLRAVRQVENGQHVELSRRSANDEVGRLADAFGRMADAVVRRERDIARHNQELAASEASLAAVIDNTGDAIWSVDEELRLVAVNAAFARRWGGGERGLAGQPVERYIPGADWAARYSRALAGEQFVLEFTEGETCLEVSFNPIRRGDAVVGVSLFARDVTEREYQRRKLDQVNKQLLEASRKSGMAEVATAVLHNVGNVLNSINVSAHVVEELFRHSKMGGLSKVVALVDEHAGDLGGWFASGDARARKVPEYLRVLSGAWDGDQRRIGDELESLRKNIDHVKVIVSMQQSHARFGGVVEPVALAELLDDALLLHGSSHQPHELEVTRRYAELPPLLLDRHKVMQIVTNLLSNARRAVCERPPSARRISVRSARAGEEQLAITVEDNGVGIPAENLARIFENGFTTKKDGHGFGLHSSACAAMEMGGRLSVRSDGPDRGATFTLTIPMKLAADAGVAVSSRA